MTDKLDNIGNLIRKTEHEDSQKLRRSLAAYIAGNSYLMFNKIIPISKTEFDQLRMKTR